MLANSCLCGVPATNMEGKSLSVAVELKTGGDWAAISPEINSQKVLLFFKGIALNQGF